MLCELTLFTGRIPIRLETLSPDREKRVESLDSDESLRKILIAYIPLVQGDMKKALSVVLRAETVEMVGARGFEPVILSLNS